MSHPLKDEWVTNSKFPKEGPIACPRCGNTNNVQRGSIKRAFTRHMNGEEELSRDLSDDIFWEVEVVECKPCGKRFLIEPDDVHQLRTRNFDLEVQVGLMEGSIQPPSKLVN